MTVHGDDYCNYSHNETYTCSGCEVKTCWCSGGTDSELCDPCWYNEQYISGDLISLTHKDRDDKMRKGEAILRFIDARRDGRKFSEITRFICEMNGRDYDERETVYEFVDSSGKRERRLHKESALEINGHLFCRIGSALYSCGKIISKKDGRRINRGYGCTWLVGSWKAVGLLHHCIKGDDGRWRTTLTTHSAITFGNKIYPLTPSRN